MPSLLDLSVEILDGIVDYLEIDTFRLRCKIHVLRLAKVSRYLYKVVHPRLYRELEFDNRKPDVIRHMEAIIEVLESRPDLASSVRDVAVNYSWYFERGLTYAHSLVRRFLGILPRLRRLALSLPKNYTLRDTFPSIYAADTLREVEIYHYQKLTIVDLIPLLGSKNLVRLEAHGWDVDGNAQLLPVDDRHGTSAIRHMIVGGSNLSDSVLSEMIRWPRQLEILNMNIPLDAKNIRRGWVRFRLSPVEISKLLDPLKSTLRELTINNSQEIWNFHDGSRWSFEGFEHLTSVNISSLLLFGGYVPDKGRAGAYKCLPRALEKLMITVPHCGMFQYRQASWADVTHEANIPDLGPREEWELDWLVELAEKKAMHFPNLQKVFIREIQDTGGPEISRSLAWEPTAQVKEAFESAAIHLFVSLLVKGFLSKADEKRLRDQSSQYQWLASF